MSHSHCPNICEYVGPVLTSLKILPLAGSNGPGPCHLIGSASAGAYPLPLARHDVKKLRTAAGFFNVIERRHERFQNHDRRRDQCN